MNNIIFSTLFILICSLSTPLFSAQTPVKQKYSPSVCKYSFKKACEISRLRLVRRMQRMDARIELYKQQIEQCTNEKEIIILYMKMEDLHIRRMDLYDKLMQYQCSQ